MGLIRQTLDNTMLVPTPSGRIWIVRRLGRGELAQLGMLHQVLGVGADEASRAAELVHLDPDDREQQLAEARRGLDEADAAKARPPVRGIVKTVARNDAIAALVVRGCHPKPDQTCVACAFTLYRDQATTPDQEAAGQAEVFWVGEPALQTDLAVIATAIELSLLEDIQAGRSFCTAAYAAAR